MDASFQKHEMDIATTTFDMSLSVTYQGYKDWIEKNYPYMKIIPLSSANKFRFEIPNPVLLKSEMLIKPIDGGIHISGFFVRYGDGNWAVAFCENSENSFPYKTERPLGAIAKEFGITISRLQRWIRIIPLHHGEGLTYAVIAEREDMSDETIKGDFEQIREKHFPVDNYLSFSTKTPT